MNLDGEKGGHPFLMDYSRKNPHPHDRRHAGKSHGRGGGEVNGSGNPDGRGAQNLKIQSQGVQRHGCSKT